VWSAGSSPMVDSAPVAAWLGGVHNSRALSAKVKKLLLDGFGEGVWLEDDMLDGTRGTAKDGRELWMTVLDDCSAVCKAPITKSDSVRLAQWVDAIFVHGESKDVTPTYVPSAAEKKDLEAQGMNAGTELRRLELACHVGRAPNTEGTVGGVYRGVPNAMAESKLAFKQNHETLDKVVERCRRECTLVHLDRFITNLASDLSASEEATDKLQSARVLMWFSEAKRNLSGATMAVLTYIDEYRATYRGRGLPVEYDTTIGQRAMNYGLAAGVGAHSMSLSGLAPKVNIAPSTATGSSLSYPSRSASESESSAAVLAMVEQLKGVSTAVSDMRSSMTALATKVDKLEGWKADQSITCSGCGEVGHRNRNCPNKDRKGKEKEEK
jgi:hypothetical protein